MRIFRVNYIWYVDYSIGGKRFRRSLHVSAKDVAKRRAQDIYQCALVESEKLSLDLSAFIGQYLEYQTACGLQPNTIRIYTHALQLFLKHAGDISIGQIDAAHLESFKAHFRLTFKPNTVNMHIRALKTALEYAARIGLIDQNPFKRVTQFKIPAVSQRIYLTEPEIQKLFNYLTGDYYDFYMFILLTGCRRMSACGLTWDNVDFGTGKLRLQNKPGGFYTVDMHPKLFEMLLRRKDSAAGERVFLISIAQASVYIKRVFRRLNFPPHFTLHHLRRSVGSHLAMQGVPRRFIADILGHADEKTAEIYIQIADDHKKEAIKSLPYADIFDTKMPSKNGN